MPKRIALIIGLLVLPLIVLVLFYPGGQGMIRRAGAALQLSTFTPPYNISYSTGNTNASQKPRARLAPDGYLHVAWMDGVLNSATGPAYNKGQGTTWPTWEWVGPHNNGGYTNPAIVLDSQGTVHVVWGGGGGSPYEIYYAYKPVGGTWSTPANLSNEGYNTVKPSIAIDRQDRLWVAWQASHTDTDEEIYVRSKPAGGSWEPVMRITTQPSGDQDPSIAIDSNDVPHLVWRSNAPGNWEILHTRYVGGGWTSFENVSASSAGSHFPKMAVDNAGNIFVTWEEETGADEFQTAVRRWSNGSWGARTFASVAGMKALYPDIAADNAGNVYVAWTDYRQSPTEVYFNHSTDYGLSWPTEEDLSQNDTSSFFPCVVAEAGGFAHVFWQDMASGQLDIYYSKATVVGAVTPVPTTAVPTVPPVPYGWVNVVALQPPANEAYTRQAAVKLSLSATSPVGNPLLMRYDNYVDFHANPTYVAFDPTVPSWSLLAAPNSCGSQMVYAQFKDQLVGTESSVYSDYIFYDDYLSATLALNGGNPYTNRTMVMANTGNGDLAAGCSGLYAMQFSENAITYTTWISYFPRLYFFLSPTGPDTRAVFGHYNDWAGNEGVRSDQIAFDRNPPFGGNAPTMPGSTNQLLVTVSNLQAFDNESGVGRVWLANNCSPNGDGVWQSQTYCSDPPCSYTWNLGYGGPPIVAPDLHKVCVKYEDWSGYGDFPGNFTPVYSGTITVNNISTIFLPVVTRGYASNTRARAPVAPSAAGLALFADPPRAGPGQDVLLYLVASPEVETPLESTLRLELPAGLRVIRAWSAYGTLLQVDERTVVSRERTSARQVAWILVQARVEPQAGPALQVLGEMAWDGGSLTASPVEVENR